MADGRRQSNKQVASKARSPRSRAIRTKNSKAGAWKAAALDRYLTVRPDDTDAGAAARVIR